MAGRGASTRKKPRDAAQRRRAIKQSEMIGDVKCTFSEFIVLDRLVRDGWEVINRGWPDFLAHRDGALRFIEVKAGGDRVSEQQKRVHELLELLGVSVEVIRP